MLCVCSIRNTRVIRRKESIDAQVTEINIHIHMLADMGEDIEKWKVPKIEDNGVITGLYAKVRKANTCAVINENSSSLRCSHQTPDAFHA